MTDDERSEEVADGEQAAAISRQMVKILRAYAGRGPDRARTTVARDHVLVVLHDTLTTVEQTVVAHGHAELIDQARRQVQDAMKPEAIELVEQITGRKVIAFMSVNHMDPDCAAELFLTEVKPGSDTDDRSPHEGEAHGR